MERKFVMTAFGNDRPGIVADVSQVIYENGCNLEDSTMTILAEEFAVILLFSGQGDDLEDRLNKDCRRLEREKAISAFIRPVDPVQPRERRHFFESTLHVEGLDQAGIVYKVSKYLAEHDVNISSLKSGISHVPESGTSIYVMEIKIQIPEGTSLDDFDNGIVQIGDDLNVDIARNDR